MTKPRGKRLADTRDKSEFGRKPWLPPSGEAYRVGDKIVEIVGDPTGEAHPSRFEKVDWVNNLPLRAAVANEQLRLSSHPKDAPLRKAFDYYRLDPADPRHWRWLVSLLARALFSSAGAPRGARTSARYAENEELVARSLRESPGKSDSEIAKKLAPKLKTGRGHSYHKASVRRMLRETRRRLNGQQRTD